MRKFFILVLVVAGLATASVAGASTTTTFVAVLSADTVAGCETSARGVAKLTVTGEDTVEYRLIVAGLDNVISAHIHLGGPGETGPIVATLFDAGGGSVDVDGLLAKGTITDPVLVSGLLGGTSYYVNVHTTECPAGALRGQVVPAED
jgi:CHRD domain